MSRLSSARRFRQLVLIFILGGYSWLVLNYLRRHDQCYNMEPSEPSPCGGTVFHAALALPREVSAAPLLGDASASPSVALLKQRGDEVWRRCSRTSSQNETQVIAADDRKNDSPPLDYLTAQMYRQLSATLIFLDNRLAWCPVTKAASSSWADAFLRIQRFSAGTLKSAQVALKRRSRSIPGQKVASFIPTTESFLVTRHPLHRVVSAYRNKLETSYGNHDGPYFYKNYGSQIVRKHRSIKAVNLYKTAEERWLHFLKIMDSGNVTEDFMPSIRIDANFNDRQNEVRQEEVMDVLVKQHKMLTKSHKLHIPPEAVFRDPSFEEFVRFITEANPAKLDEHWKPIYLYCQVCRVRYKFILRYETMRREAAVFVEYLKSEGVLPESFELRHENKGGTSEQTTRKYLSLLPAGLLRKLIALYRPDLEIFGYEVGDFI